MNRRDTLLALLALGVACAPLRVNAQPAHPARPLRIGLLPGLLLVINLKTAKAIGLKIPQELLLRADEVIE